MLTESEVRGMKVAELKAELAKLDLPQGGKKDELIERLLQHMATAGSSARETKKTAVHAEPAAPAASATAPSPILVDDETARRLARAARFGIDPVEPPKSSSKPAKPEKASAVLAADPSLRSPEAIKRRIERFGVVEPEKRAGKPAATGSPAAVPVDYEQLKARQERFGVVTSSALAKSEMEEAKRRRLERFGGQ